MYTHHCKQKINDFCFHIYNVYSSFAFNTDEWLNRVPVLISFFEKRIEFLLFRFFLKLKIDIFIKKIQTKINLIKINFQKFQCGDNIFYLSFFIKSLFLFFILIGAFFLVAYNSTYYKISILRIFLLAITSLELAFCSKNILKDKR